MGDPEMTATYGLMGASCGYEEINDITMYYELYGDGEPLLLIHGGGGSIRNFCYQLPLLSNSYRVVAPENRGHGRTSVPSGPLNYHQFAEDVIGLMDRLELGSAHVLGFSCGAVIGLDMAIHHPGRIGKFVAFAPNIHTNGLTPKTREHLAAIDPEEAPRIFGKSDIASEADQRLLSDFLRNWKAMLLAGELIGRQDLSRIESRTLVMAGDHDVVTLEHTIEIYEGIPDSELMIVPGGSHAAVWERPMLINEAIVDFLSCTTRSFLMPG